MKTLEKDELRTVDYILAQMGYGQEANDALLGGELQMLGMDQQRANLYMLGQICLAGDESDMLKQAQGIVLRENAQMGKIALDTVVQEEQIVA